MQQTKADLLAIVQRLKIGGPVCAQHVTPEIAELLKDEDPRVWMRAVLAIASNIARDDRAKLASRHGAQQVMEVLKSYLDSQAN